MIKKNLSNDKAEVLANFITQQLPKTHLQACNVILSLSYPIADKHTLCQKIEKVKGEEFIKQIVLETFIPSDFVLGSAMNALEKFQYRTNMGNVEGTTAMNQMTGYSTPVNSHYNGVNTVAMNTAFNGMPLSGISSPVNSHLYGINTVPVNSAYPSMPMTTLSTPVNGASTWNNQWQGHSPMTTVAKTTNWEFGLDICGEVASSLFCDLVSKGIAPVNAYGIAQEREVSCRTALPTYGTDDFARKAQTIFVQNCILLGKSLSQCNWVAQFYLNNCRPTTKTNGTNAYNGSTPVERKLVTNVN